MDIASLFNPPTEEATDYSALVEKFGSQDPCVIVSAAFLQSLFTTECSSDYGKSYKALGLNLFFRGDVSELSGKVLVRGYIGGKGAGVLVPIKTPTAKPKLNWTDFCESLLTKTAVGKSESTTPTL